ncbi:MAG: hypothetical protein WB439_02715, partial [Acidobacteriaceae bacterium]
MKRILAFFLTIAAPMLGQAMNPQNTFPNAVQSIGPSFYLNYNDLTSSFKDSVSGMTMTNTAANGSAAGPNCKYGAASGATLSCSLTATAGDALIVFIASSVVIDSVVDSGGATDIPIANFGASDHAYYFANVTAGSHTITAKLASSTSYPQLQVVDVAGASSTSPIDNYVTNVQSTPTTSMTSGPLTTSGNSEELVGFTAGAGAGGTWSAGSPAFSLATGFYANQIIGTYNAATPGSYTFNATSSVSLGWSTILIAVKGASETFGTVATQQPGFDYTNNAQYSAEFPYNAWSVAPNDTLGAVDWNTPFSMMWQIDRLNWNREGTLVLASKGDISSNSNNWWKLTLQQAGYSAQFCFYANAGALGQPQGACASSLDVPDGFGYNVVVTNSATGANGVATGTTNAFQIYVNGIDETASVAPYGQGFGKVTLAVSGGTGYANSTAFTSSGGGINCNVAGTMNSTSGVPTSLTVAAGQPNYGCTSDPNIVLTAPTGTGAAITATPIPLSINSTSYPVMAPGYVSTGVYYGVDGTDSTQAPTYIDEFAEFPGVLTASQIANLFYTTKWYQALAPIPASLPVVILSEDGCGGTDNIFSLLMLIRAQQAGLITLAGVESTTLDGTSQAYYRQVLDQAGLNNVPVAADTGAAIGAGNCTSANITSYNASTPQTAASYETSSTMYRMIFAKYPSTPVYIANGGPLDGIAQFMASPADGISSLTGAQLWARNGGNGGFLAIQGVGCCGTFGDYYSYPASQTVLTGNGTTPVYGWNSTPQSGGPGILASRTRNDPTWLLFNSLGSDSRSCGDCLTVAQAMFPGNDPFGGGVTVNLGGSGTGYAASTPFTSAGGGTSCHVSGFMLSAGGVPSSIVGAAGQSNTTPYGIGFGCYNPSSPPTISLVGATGTGATLTASTSGASPCGGVTQTTSTNGTVATTPCTNFYTEWPQVNAVSGTPLFQWFINSLVDLAPVG